MSSATEVLRRMLDERGVEHSDFASAYRLSTRWQDSGKRVIEHQLRKDADIGDMGIVRNLTPEQAIAATLGAGTCKLPETRIDHGSIEYNGVTEWRRCSACGTEVLAYPARFCPNCGRKVVDA